MASKSFLPTESTECWDPVNDDDFVVVRSGGGKGNRSNIWLKLGLEMLKWELWGWKQVRLEPFHLRSYSGVTKEVPTLMRSHANP